ncbi:hypothetical protein GALMADRAFT_220817 [Galerina marginata CBS 339.88]|uniref:MSP domain-containing protein n=1 Tax=Galerina marginata (strain CBS 339.88) TaxID=685588 RepID=A0A067TKF4_GALM3|nr:hypothetical protein GALMADRAFT_220817 [Galerina marginata CBS 339.88]
MPLSFKPNSSIDFRRPLTLHDKRSLTITNKNHQHVVFRIDTTAPEHYCVWPSVGRLYPQESTIVSILFLPLGKEPPLTAKCNDEVYIHSAFIPLDRVKGCLSSIIQATLDKDEKGGTFQHTLHVNYLSANHQTNESAAVKLTSVMPVNKSLQTQASAKVVPSNRPRSTLAIANVRRTGAVGDDCIPLIQPTLESGSLDSSSTSFYSFISSQSRIPSLEEPMNVTYNPHAGTSDPTAISFCSVAASRTNTTDYGLYYTRRKISQGTITGQSLDSFGNERVSIVNG